MVRMIILSKLDFNNISYDMLDSVFWTVVEPALVIINACLPTIRPLLQEKWETLGEKAATVTGDKSLQLDCDEYPFSPLTNARDVLWVHAPDKS